MDCELCGSLMGDDDNFCVMCGLDYHDNEGRMPNYKTLCTALREATSGLARRLEEEKGMDSTKAAVHVLDHWITKAALRDGAGG